MSAGLVDNIRTSWTTAWLMAAQSQQGKVLPNSMGYVKVFDFLKVLCNRLSQYIYFYIAMKILLCKGMAEFKKAGLYEN